MDLIVGLLLPHLGLRGAVLLLNEQAGNTFDVVGAVNGPSVKIGVTPSVLGLPDKTRKENELEHVLRLSFEIFQRRLRVFMTCGHVLLAFSGIERRPGANGAKFR